jgi:hypothetical protein
MSAAAGTPSPTPIVTGWTGLIVSAYIVALFLGNQVRLGGLPLCNVLLPVAFVATLATTLDLRQSRSTHALVALFLAYIATVALQVPSLLESNITGAVTKTLYTLHPAYFAVLAMCADRVLTPKRLHSLVYAGLLCDAAICALQLIGILTGTARLDFLMQLEQYGEWLVTGAFGNPNNQAVVALMAIVALEYLRRFLPADGLLSRRQRIASLAAAGVTLVTLSRLVLLLLVLLALVRYRRQILRPVGLVAIACIAAAIIWLLSGGAADTNLSAVDRIASRLDTLSDIGDILTSDASISFRIEIYKRFLNSISYLPFGLGYNNYNPFFAGMRYYQYFLSESPHTYVGEVLLASGLVGALTLLLLIYLFLDAAIRGRTLAPLSFASVFLISSFVPSSMILTPAALLMLFVPLLPLTQTVDRG